MFLSRLSFFAWMIPSKPSEGLLFARVSLQYCKVTFFIWSFVTASLPFFGLTIAVASIVAFLPPTILFLISQILPTLEVVNFLISLISFVVLSTSSSNITLASSSFVSFFCTFLSTSFSFLPTVILPNALNLIFSWIL